MENDPFPFDTLSLTQLGQLFGVTSHVVGRWLKDAGLRLPNGEPARSAIDAGLAHQVVLGEGQRPFWAWHKEKAVMLLEHGGHHRPSPPPPDSSATTRLLGPFASQRNGEGDGFEIADSNGVVAIWVRGKWLADIMVKLLNLGWRSGRWFV